MIPGTPTWNALHKVWLKPQQLLDQVVRWGKYVDDKDGEVREQNTLQHTHSLTLLGQVFMVELGRHLPSVDWSFLISALTAHDIGEGLVGEDTVYINKTIEKDIREWERFSDYTSGLPKVSRNALNRAFLLQFCLDDEKIAAFPADAREIMIELADRARIEAMIFEAIERFDYVLYAQEQLVVFENLKIVIQVLRHQVPHLNRIAHELPGFAEYFWPAESRKWHEDLLKQYAGKWIETKSPDPVTT